MKPEMFSGCFMDEDVPWYMFVRAILSTVNIGSDVSLNAIKLTIPSGQFFKSE